MSVIVLGQTGMLGGQLMRTLAGAGLETTGTTRDTLNAETASIDDIAKLLEGHAWCFNAIGLIKPYIKDNNPDDIERAIAINSVFPGNLVQAAQKAGCRVVQIATDCVWDGAKGAYLETDAHNARDMYGKSKSMGEQEARGFYNIRCSIIGRESQGYLSLLEWFLRQPQRTTLRGFTNHFWNGVTTLHFAKLCAGIATNNPVVAGSSHFIPADTISKHDLLHVFAKEFNRTDITIEPFEAPEAVDRTLATANPERNATMWQWAGYDAPPTIAQMVRELAAHG